jgi:hypothetical protein
MSPLQLGQMRHGDGGLTSRKPFTQFLWATVPGKRLQVAETDHAQAQARKLVAAGMVAYENKYGLIRDLGIPRHPPKFAGRIFSKLNGRVEVRDPA